MHFKAAETFELKRAGVSVDAWGELDFKRRHDADLAARTLAPFLGTRIDGSFLGAHVALHQMQHWLLQNLASVTTVPLVTEDVIRALAIESPPPGYERRAFEEGVLLVSLAENPQASMLAPLLPDVARMKQLLTSTHEAAGTEGGALGPLPEEVLRIAFVHRHAVGIDAQIDHLLRQFRDTLIRCPQYQAWLDLRFRLTEETRWHARHEVRASGSAEVLRFDSAGRALGVHTHDDRRFSEDKGWMPRVVLLAKSVYVWLAQLSVEFGRPIVTLADIPDEVLDGISSRGFTSLWLIGIWQRSKASATIKERQGIGDAIASAYSIDSYAIDDKLGGQAAYANLASRAKERGIRLAADLVPNHMGIDGDWVIKHPDFFVQSETCPYEGYRFSADVSSDANVATYVEDGYFSRTDAAVVFKRVDRVSGKAVYIYHGNDGTSMPWNDTAQLDYTKPIVRRAMLDLIVHVAKMFPILRFDAAMTLAKRHYQRLWFPHPGGGDAIASRWRFAMSQDEFDRAMPEEFWREVVAEVAEKAPDTLLLAEAFWMMEGYFVRSLGMHRVYNSAFMNMFKSEENAKYHELIRNVVEYDSEILGRFVNFMNNPDEEPAAVQFGTTDKYFAVCTLLATLPGTPMFGHGQFEGFREKYGMEFYRPRQNETVDTGLFAAHEAKIVPLLRRRFVFAQAGSFRLFPLEADGGRNDNVFAFCNAHGGDMALVLVHNRYEVARGKLARSIAFRSESGALVVEEIAPLLFGAQQTVTLVHAVSGATWSLDRRDVERDGLLVELGPYAHDVWWVKRSDAAQRVESGCTIESNRDSAFSSVAMDGPNEKRT